MYRQQSKRKQLVKLITIYTAMSTTVIVLVAILVFFMLGFQFNKADGKIEQGGLVQFSSQPTGAEILINGSPLGSRTPSKKTMATGDHFITMQRDGYQQWQKSVSVLPGSVLWLTYARMVPTELKPENVADFDAISSSATSRDNKWMAIKTDTVSPTLRIADLTRDSVEVETLTLPTASYTPSSPDKPQAFVIDRWHADSRQLLVKHTYNDTSVEWLMVDTRNIEETINITKLLGINASKIVMSTNSSLLFALVDGTVRKINLDAATLSGPLLANIADFSLYDNTRIVYTTLIDPATNMRSVGYFDDGADAPRTVRTYSDNGQAPLHLALGKYFDKFIVAISYDKAVEIVSGALPRSDAVNPSALEAFATMTIPEGVQYLSINTNGRFVFAQSAADFVMYDVELKKMTATHLKGSAALTKELKWLDGYTIWSDQDGQLRTYEFDGANQHDIMPVVEGTSVTYSPNAKYIYALNKADSGKFHLSRVQMILE